MRYFVCLTLEFACHFQPVLSPSLVDISVSCSFVLNFKLRNRVLILEWVVAFECVFIHPFLNFKPASLNYGCTSLWLSIRFSSPIITNLWTGSLLSIYYFTALAVPFHSRDEPFFACFIQLIVHCVFSFLVDFKN